MTSQAFDYTLAAFSHWEGGWSDHSLDPGGATKYGITIHTLSAWRGRRVSKQEVRDLTYSEARQIYKAWYWDKVQADRLPPAVSVVAMDAAVNQGVKQSGKFLQRAYNSNVSRSARIRVDGAVGPNTLRAVNSIPVEILLRDFMAYRTLHYSGLKTLWTFGFGWFRRVFDMHAKAVQLLPASKDPKQGNDHSTINT